MSIKSAEAAFRIHRLDILAVGAGAVIAASCLFAARGYSGLDDREVLLLCAVALAGAVLALTGVLGLMHLAVLRCRSGDNALPRNGLPPES